MIKLIMTDIDGTLLPDGTKNLNPEYYQVIGQLIDKGITFVVASGRHLMSIENVFAPIIDKLWVVSQNGSIITHDGQSRNVNPIPTEIVREFWQDLSHFDDEIDSLIETADKAFCPHANTQMYKIITEQYEYKTEELGGWDYIPDLEYSVMVIYHPHGAESFVNEHMREKWGSRIELATSGEFWVDCTMPGISKGNVLNILCEQLGISLDETIAFGDNMNDISMLQAAGTGYAVNNARQEVQDAADKVIPGYKEDGVLQELKKILEMC